MLTLVTQEQLDYLFEEREKAKKYSNPEYFNEVNDTLIFYFELMMEHGLAIVNESEYEQKQRELMWGLKIKANNGTFKAEVVE